jgi:hypothetical protein
MENVIFTKFSSQKLVHVHHSILLSHEIYYFRNVSPSHGMLTWKPTFEEKIWLSVAFLK